ncbi:hypothetical protein PZ938_10910 [Luteipulveratus sp. YIM 133132]|uniref:hypothetical protein n=1 Tax=Luteipulveratus flavus TaxID=3031728 RepID=UPI0023AEAD36|nr:hypothetical protein [Luteipulveratus sp. YIM 133132]MDE9366115.1 hypothetical protein [Luteipulveratus sp. YIM 133132]
MKRLAALSLASGSLALTALTATATTAVADSSQCTNYVAGSYATCAGHAWFQSNGEHLYIEDRVADGHSVAVHYTVNGVTKTAYNRNSANGAVVDLNLDLPEGAVITYSVCLSNSSTDLAGSCSGGIRDYA